MTSKLLILVFALALTQSSIAESGVSFEWVTVGDPGNPNDPLTGISTGGQTSPVRGAVPYAYSISKYETTIGQYTAFLNAVAKSDPERAFSLYDEGLGHYDTIRGIARISVDGKDVYYVKNVSDVAGAGGTSAYLPITFVAYPDAVRFANWLHNGQGDGSTETGAYTITEGQITRVSRSGGVVTLTTAEPHSLNIGDWVWANENRFSGSGIVTARTDTTFSFSDVRGDLPEQELQGQMIGISARKPDARYWVPSENEWYKAAYYDPSPEGPANDYWLYPWRSDSAFTRAGNYYVSRFYTTNQIIFQPYYTYVSDVRDGAASYYGAVNQAGNVEEWTEGDVFSGGPHTRGGWWNKSSTDPSFPQTYAFRRIASYYALPPGVAPEEPSDEGRGLRIATVANPPAGGLRNGDKIRFHPRAGHNGRMVGGVFEATTDSSVPYTVLHTITETPLDGWTEVSVDFGKARHFRYRSPDGGYGNVAEIEFYRSGAKVVAAASGTPGSWSGKNNDTFKAALDGDPSTFFDAPEPNGAYVDLDTGRGTPSGTPQGNDYLTVTGTNANGSGFYPPGQRVRVYVSVVPEGQSFAGWEGFTSILDDPSSPETYATIPGIGVNFTLNATFKPQPPGTHRLDVEGGSGDGTYPAGTVVTVSADPPQEFARWTGDIAILSNPFLATTTALIPSMNVRITATYRAFDSDTIRFYPRSGFAQRMVGGVFEGTNGDPVTGPYTTIYTVTNNPPLAWTEVRVNPLDYRYLRYRGQSGSYGNVAEIEFYHYGVKLTGTGFGTPGSWSNSGNSFEKALDGDVNTFFDAPDADGNYAGIDAGATGSGDTIRFYPRSGFTERMVGGVFEGTNGDPVNGPYTTIYTVTNNPPLAWTEVSVSLGDYRYLRYRGPSGSYGNVAEIEFYRAGVKVPGAGFGTPGSWSNGGNTFEKALDVDTNTFFDAPTPDGNYVGIVTP
jgi:formylglycine-generating enzyme required for sulfatase activity